MNTYVFIIFGLIYILLGSAIVVVVVYYSRLLEKYQQVQKQNIYLRFHVTQKGLEKINIAREKSLKIIQDAALQAEEIVRRAEILKTDTNEKAKIELASLTNLQKDALAKASADLLSVYEEAIKHLNDDDINILKNVTKNIEGLALEEVKQFEKQLHDETVGQQEVVDKKIQEAFGKAEEELAAYKKEKLLAIDHEVYELLKRVTKDVIGKRLSFDDQRELVMAALERAKKEMITI